MSLLDQASEEARRLGKLSIEAVRRAIQEASGAEVTVEEAPATECASYVELCDREGSWRVANLNRAITGPLFLGVSQTDLQQLIKSAVKDAGESNAPTEPGKLNVLLGQIAASMAALFSGEIGPTDVAFLETGPMPNGGVQHSAWRVSCGQTAKVVLVWSFPEPVLQSYRRSLSADDKAALQPSNAVGAASGAQVPLPNWGGKADLLMDVELDVTIRFGERRLLLRDLVELNNGDVIELDRQIQEPAELLVGGKVMAMGEVVLVDGNYGLRITKVMSRAERAQMIGVANG